MTHAILSLLMALVPPPPPADADEGSDCPSGQLCVLDGSAEWLGGESMSDKARAKEYKKYKKRKDVALTVQTAGDGRGSVFVDGVFAGTVPLRDYVIKPGKHDVEVRDGDKALVSGVLKVSKKTEFVTTTFGTDD